MYSLYSLYSLRTLCTLSVLFPYSLCARSIVSSGCAVPVSPEVLADGQSKPLIYAFSSAQDDCLRWLSAGSFQ